MNLNNFLCRIGFHRFTYEVRHAKSYNSHDLKTTVTIARFCELCQAKILEYDRYE